ncbi:MAG: ATP-binding protein [Clostridia bacterium]|nr:ATP-binding protein [Clostridia bacterium]
MKVKITVNAVKENLTSVTQFVDSLLEEADCPMKAQLQIDVAIDEIFSNVANYAYYPGTGDVTVDVEITKDPRGVVITFCDSGIPFDPLKSEEPDISLSAEERKIGGLGLFIVKKTMDDISYEYKDGYNVLKITKRF